MKIRVYYEDTDAGGIVYHTNYIKYCERARSEMFFQKNMMPLDGDKSGFVVRNIIADFLGFATLGDILEVSTKIVKKRAASVIIEHQIYNQENKNIFNMEVLLIFVRDGKPSPIPKNLKDIFKEE
ncbi:MAG TPA: YbgC/FadM family acyl-CoA thioesterase [Campylobacterales bacterium]|nr:YbgC/FadM family acyl-CoA thioesterase [Campylobacterales bacterium]HHC11243.1 YbgC/FadM family acyl-CoA thioesterase [Campylobacterales bacterium]